MLLLAAVFFLGVAIAVLALRSRADKGLARMLAAVVAGFAVAIAVVLLLFACFIAVPAGNVGVQVLFGRVRPEPLDEGLHLVNPLVKIQPLSIRTEAYTMSNASVQQKSRDYDSWSGSTEVRIEDAVTAVSSDGLSMTLDATILYRLVPGDAPWVYRNLGQEYVDKIIRPAARTGIREATAQFTSQEAYSTRREELATKMQELLVARIKQLLADYPDFKGQAFIIQQVMLRNVDLPAVVRSAIETKLSSEQDAQRMQFVLQKEKQEAERMRVMGQGIADYQGLIAKNVTESVLRWKGIEVTAELAKSPNAKIVIIGSPGTSGLPLIFNPDTVAK